MDGKGRSRRMPYEVFGPGEECNFRVDGSGKGEGNQSRVDAKRKGAKTDQGKVARLRELSKTPSQFRRKDGQDHRRKTMLV